MFNTTCFYIFNLYTRVVDAISAISADLPDVERNDYYTKSCRVDQTLVSDIH